jgi:hypothetical protein
LSENQEPREGASGRLKGATLPDPNPEHRSDCSPPKTGLARVSRDRSRGESGDAYSGALFQIPGTSWRVAVCAKGYCWILQQREAKDHWIGRKFFSNKRRLATVVNELLGEEAYRSVSDGIEALPV